MSLEFEGYYISNRYYENISSYLVLDELEAIHIPGRYHSFHTRRPPRLLPNAANKVTHPAASFKASRGSDSLFQIRDVSKNFSGSQLLKTLLSWLVAAL